MVASRQKGHALPPALLAGALTDEHDHAALLKFWQVDLAVYLGSTKHADVACSNLEGTWAALALGFSNAQCCTCAATRSMKLSVES